MILIGLTGFAGVGKDTIATLLQETHQADSFRIAFADQLKQEVSKAFQCPLEVLTDPQLKNRPSLSLRISNCTNEEFSSFIKKRFPRVASTEPNSPRVIFQTWGDWRRESDLNYFVKPVEKAVRSAEDFGVKLALVTDVRFCNEALFINNTGGQIWRVLRSNKSAINDHASEHTLVNYPIQRQIMNDGNIDLLRKKIRDLYFSAVGEQYHRQFLQTPRNELWLSAGSAA